MKCCPARYWLMGGTTVWGMHRQISYEDFIKLKVFCWLAIKKRLLTAANLLKRGWSGDTDCVLRGSEKETVYHYLVHKMRFRWIHFCDGCWGSTAWGSGSRRSLSILRRIGFQIIWENRNDTIFRTIQSDPLRAVRA